MLWIVQDEMYTENRRHELLGALDRLDIPFTLVKVSGNTTYPEVNVEIGDPVITNGSVMLSNIAKARGWAPGSFLNDNFSYETWSKNYADLILNKNAKVCALRDAKVTAPRVFARPVLDDKTFNGRVFELDEFLALQRDSVERKKGSADPDTKILLSSPKTIGQEHRHYIVDGHIVTSSRYKLSGMANFREGADDAVLDVVKKAIGLWTPARAFVIDTYVSGDEIGIVEIGCIAHAGLYEADLIKLVSALDSMPMDPDTAPAPVRMGQKSP
jgi:hypothetical protein